MTPAVVSIRTAIVAGSLGLSLFSVAVDSLRPAPGSTICRYGGCRLDQIYDGLEHDARPADAALIVLRDAANPLAWCTYGEILSTRGDIPNAVSAFARATTLGPGVAAVWMRAANFDFTHGRHEAGLRDAAKVLSLTDGFDAIVFSYLGGTGLDMSRVLDTAVPAQPRSARAWLGWLRAHGSDRDMLATWAWMTRQGLADNASARDLVQTLWEHKAYTTAQHVWRAWLGPRGADDSPTERLVNRRFADEPNGTPFDWTLTAPPSVTILRKDGLAVRFAGTENLAFASVQQHAILEPGRYHFSANVASEGLSTDQRPFFRIVDLADTRRLSVETQQVESTTSGSVVSVDFSVTRDAEVVGVQLVRRPSLRFDSKIAGTLHVREASLVAIPARAR